MFVLLFCKIFQQDSLLFSSLWSHGLGVAFCLKARYAQDDYLDFDSFVNLVAPSIGWPMVWFVYGFCHLRILDVNILHTMLFFYALLTRLVYSCTVSVFGLQCCLCQIHHFLKNKHSNKQKSKSCMSLPAWVFTTAASRIKIGAPKLLAKTHRWGSFASRGASQEEDAGGPFVVLRFEHRRLRTCNVYIMSVWQASTFIYEASYKSQCLRIS